MSMKQRPRFPLASCFFVSGHVGAVGAWRIHWLAAAPTFQNLVGACRGKPVHCVPRRPGIENAALGFAPDAPIPGTAKSAKRPENHHVDNCFS